MKKNLLLTLLLVFLVLMNGVLLFLFFSKPPRRSGPPHMFVVKELNFNTLQMEQYQVLDQKFEQGMRPLHHRRRQLKNEMFKMISEGNGSVKEIDSITDLIGDSEKERDLKVYYHFRAIYELCNPEQKKRFQRIVQDALQRGRKKGPGPPHGH
ncbi:Spy/CpxP family protein refolding chaperone [Spongiimicrobium sp. 3-5]|uniref:Spy/CpxP family protein refolding chaperone n=1 Tax=Spongiimicrobium sp. 3-5 TaxID=3332596 RepID=UPI003980E02C